MTQWQPAEADADMKARFRTELEAIYKHLGSEAPETSTEVTPQVNKDGQTIYITPTEVYALAGDDAMRYRPSSDGQEDATYWRDGVQVRRIVNPPPGISN